MANLHIDENTEIGDTGFTLKQVLTDIGALYERSTKVSDEMVRMSKNIQNEYNIFIGNKYFTSATKWEWLCDHYNLYTRILTKFPLRDGYTRSYKLCVEKTDSITVDRSPLYISLWNYYSDTHIHDFLFENTWGASSDGTMAYYEMDFDINLIKNLGHTKWYTTPPFAIGNGYPWRIYRLYLKVIDTYNGIAY